MKVSETRPNILLIISDQHTHDIMSCAGCDWVRTPNLDRLAAAGTRFTAAYASYPLCVPSRASMMTGRPPHQVEVDPNRCPHSLGSVMRQAGYETAYFGKWHVGNTRIHLVSDWHGFETYNDFRQYDDETAKAAAEHLRKRHDQPLFTVASFLNPHDCCEYARAQTVDLYKRRGGELPDHIKPLADRVLMKGGDVDLNPPLDQCPPLPANHLPCNDESEAMAQRRRPVGATSGGHPTQTWGDDDWREYRWGYARLVEKMDAEVGKLLSALEESGQLERTVILYTNDHGDGIGAHKWNQKWCFYEEPVRAPLIVSWKGKTPSGMAAPLVSTGLDLLPTICDYAGAAAPEGLLGRSLRPFTTEPGLAPAESHPFVVSELGEPHIRNHGRMVRSERFKYIVFATGANREMLFDLQEGPGEMKNLAMDAKYSRVMAEHRAMLAEWRRATDDTAFPPVATPPTGAEQCLT